jgi:hypothetical protein
MTVESNHSNKHGILFPDHTDQNRSRPTAYVQKTQAEEAWTIDIKKVNASSFPDNFDPLFLFLMCSSPFAVVKSKQRAKL